MSFFTIKKHVPKKSCKLKVIKGFENNPSYIYFRYILGLGSKLPVPNQTKQMEVRKLIFDEK